MRAVDIEEWALRVIDRIKQDLPIEDSRVELKAKWVENPNHIARRIAGHCNANAGDNVLWIIGADESSGLTGVDHRDMAKWWPSVCAHFEGQPPAVQDIAVTSESITIVALLFSTDHVPFVVRNAAHGKQGGGGGPVQREVPWREGTSVRSATHADLVRLLIPVANLPKLEPYKSEASSLPLYNIKISEVERDSSRTLSGETTIYAVAPLGPAIVLPDHQAFGSYTIPERDITGNLNVSLLAGSWSSDPVGFQRWGQDSRDRRTHTVFQGDSQILLDGPGFFRISWYTTFPNIESETDWKSVGPLDISLGVRAAGRDLSAIVQFSLAPHFSPTSGISGRPSYEWRWLG